jgi:hypothetical protein
MLTVYVIVPEKNYVFQRTAANGGGSVRKKLRFVPANGGECSQNLQLTTSNFVSAVMNISICNAKRYHHLINSIFNNPFSIAFLFFALQMLILSTAETKFDVVNCKFGRAE